MRLRFIDYDEQKKQQAAMKPLVGDTVIYEGVKYIVKEVGLRYVRGHRKGGNPNAVSIMKIQDITRVIDNSDFEGVNPALNFNP